MARVYQDVIIAGFGGQGVMFVGNLLAQAGMEYGLEVSFIPVYGAEMRGGTANCTVVLDSEPIGSPLVREPMSVIVLNEPSLVKFQPRLRADGVQVVNTSLIDASLVDAGRRSVCIPANDVAHRQGNVKLTNMVALGAWLKATDVLPLAVVQEALQRVVSPHYAGLVPVNARALEAGYRFFDAA
ncbi:MULTISPECIES: 2-oxoacid:acceptor oxidoreductase family protein [unclassified Desulfovibrio]|uniref:2-oxoacid:acceptor oxidoreductase family protein n=1 Tax=unclassified Desulfovibrio TaxID=2593640 RepID=UPI000F5EA9C7|nr:MULTISPECIES: 2-oxoacid:acceptor oxidoreductase family protein [unclassified Desulfovibrio]RRD69279.1 2-oxoacid:ferredoxin oxidoreductase subunit gamma [Desulfovibrio sp. OH1209_COT-279]RRD85739.1 2-oxoacid:ferredoxin oxidoreductase subunit gamma [Desulfovibrio sp. OH1186_COT-070]